MWHSSAFECCENWYSESHTLFKVMNGLESTFSVCCLMWVKLHMKDHNTMLSEQVSYENWCNERHTLRTGENEIFLIFPIFFAPLAWNSLQTYPQNFTEGLSPLWKSPPRKPYFTIERDSYSVHTLDVYCLIWMKFCITDWIHCCCVFMVFIKVSTGKTIFFLWA